MPARRHGAIDAFYGTAPSTLTTTGAPNALSKKIMVSQDSDQVTLYAQVAAATTLNVLVAHSGGLSASGNEPDYDNPPADGFFAPLYYTGTQMKFTFAGAGNQALAIPDCSYTWICLQSTATTTALAGIEISAN